MISNTTKKLSFYGSTVIALSMIIIFSSFDLLGKESYQKEFSCDAIRTCSNCKDKKGTLDWLKEFNRKHGSVKSVLTNIEKYESQEIKDTKLFDKDFYDNYGAYVYLKLPLMKSKTRLVAMRHLLSNGVHPYETVLGIDTIAGTVVSFEDVAGLKLLIKSGKLVDCKSQLEDLYTIAKRTKNEKVINLLERILAR